ncbi:MAG: hypothetical protein P8178_14450 [Candidatus Thiodiazotropha sp.]|jgi:hypothetical protein
MTGLRISTLLLDMDWKPSERDKNAEWERYTKLLTRIATQDIAASSGDEKSALTSIYSLLPTTRAIIKENGRDCIEFTKLAIVVLNQKIRPFTSKWHKLSIEQGFNDSALCEAYRSELRALQAVLRIYTSMLADMAGVEDMTGLVR